MLACPNKSIGRPLVGPPVPSSALTMAVKRRSMSTDGEDAYSNGSDSGNGDGDPNSSNAYSRAFGKIMKRASSHNESMGPVLAARKQLVAKKLEEELNEQRKKTEARKEKQELREKCHFLPQPHADAKEMSLIKLATKGVVTLFNAVSKAQKVQAGSESLNARDARAVVKQSKAAFLSEVKTRATTTAQKLVQTSTHDLETFDEEKPAWSVLQDDFMLGKSKLKDWDKHEDTGNDSFTEAFDNDSTSEEDM